MRALVQRVTRAAVRVDGETVGEIGPGLLVLLGITHDDDEGVCDRLAVMCRGTLSGARPISEWDQHAVMEAATAT